LIGPLKEREGERERERERERGMERTPAGEKRERAAGGSTAGGKEVMVWFE